MNEIDEINENIKHYVYVLININAQINKLQKKADDTATIIKNYLAMKKEEKRPVKVGDIYYNNKKYLMILRIANDYVYGIRKQLPLNAEFSMTLLKEKLKHWKHIGNIETAANQINNGLNVFENFVEDDASIPF